MPLLQGTPHYKHYFNLFDDMLADKVIPIRSSNFCLKFYKSVSHIPESIHLTIRNRDDKYQFERKSESNIMQLFFSFRLK